jgi:hypothetical protein
LAIWAVGHGVGSCFTVSSLWLFRSLALKGEPLFVLAQDHPSTFELGL